MPIADGDGTNIRSSGSRVAGQYCSIPEIDGTWAAPPFSCRRDFRQLDSVFPSARCNWWRVFFRLLLPVDAHSRGTRADHAELARCGVADVNDAPATIRSAVV